MFVNLVGGYFAVYQSCEMVNSSLYEPFKYLFFLINHKGRATKTSLLTSTQISGQATMGSITTRTTRNAATMQTGKTNDVEPLLRKTMGSTTRRTTRNVVRMQAGKTNYVEPVPRTSVGGILIREGSTSVRVTPQSAPTRLRDLKGKSNAML